MVREAAHQFFAVTGMKPFAFSHQIKGNVPVSRGLGSSVTVRLGVLMGLNALSDEPLSKQSLFELCAKLEGHPDNAAPAAFGGFTVARGKAVLRFSVGSSLRFVLLIPPFEVRTPDARKVLPTAIPQRDAAKSAANAALLAAAFASKNYAALKGAFEDALHQPYRLKLVPMLDRVIAAGERAGALGGFLSGSGSTIACVTLENAAAVAEAMKRAARDRDATTMILQADNSGARVLKAF